MRALPPGSFPRRIPDLAFSFAPALMIDAALKNRVFEALDKGARDLAGIRAATGASQRGLAALLEGLAGIGLVAREGRRFRLTPDASAYLVPGRPGYLGGIFLHAAGQLVPAWSGLAESVRTGKPALSSNREEDGAPFFKEYVSSLFPLSYPAARELAARLVPRRTGPPLRALDLGAGSGVWGIALAKRSRRVRVTAVDWPAVLETARRACAGYRVAERFDFAAGDMLSVDLESGFDIAVLGNVLHSEGEDRGRALLKRAARLLKPGGKIAVADWFVDADRSGPSAALAFALNMLATTEHGGVFALETVSGWMEDAGFSAPGKLDFLPPLSLLLAGKP